MNDSIDSTPISDARNSPEPDDRKLNVEKLRRSEERYRALVEASSQAVWSWSPNEANGDFEQTQLWWEEITGQSPEQQRTNQVAWLEVVHPEDRAATAEAWSKALSTGVPYDVEYRVHARNGDWRYIKARGIPIPGPDGSPREWVGTLNDVTEHRRAEAEMFRVTAESERQRRMYETALSNNADFVYLFDLEGRFTYVNKALLDLWRKDISQAVGKNFFELDYPPELAARLQRQIQGVISTGAPVRDETPYTSDDGTRAYEYIFMPVYGTDGRIEAVAGSTRDVTDRQRMEQTLRDADRKKDDFIALLAHELRNPLAPIRNGLEIIGRADDPKIRERSKDIMGRQLTHMVRMIDDLLDVSRIGRQKMTLRRSLVGLTEILNSAIETSRPAIDEANHELFTSLPTEEIYLDGDLTRLSQVFSNLLTNSAKYTESGGRIWLSVEQHNDRVNVSVADDGIGIPHLSLPTLFEMFSQTDRSLDRSAGGLGIGLALVKGLVEMHGGSVAASSEGEGKGSTFTVTLPVVKGREQTASDSSGIPSPSAKPKRRVLVVDDNRDGAESMSEMLRLFGDEVQTAHDGLEALEQAEQFRPQIVLMDVGMPRLNGLEATQRLRESEWGRSMVIIALTGWGQANDRDRTRAAGCDGHLVKPVTHAELEQLLRDVSAGRLK